jgi:hypothetical protein
LRILFAIKQDDLCVKYQTYHQAQLDRILP